MFKAGRSYTVIIAVMNGIEGDSRVRRVATSLHDAGIGVLLVGCLSKGKKTKIQNFAIAGSDVPMAIVKLPSKVPEGMSREDFFQVRKGIFARKLAQLVETHTAKIFHSHDYTLIGAGGAIKEKFSGSGLIWIHDLHEWMEGLTNISAEIYGHALAEERRAIRDADFLFTVSPQVSDVYCKTYDLPVPPTVLLNTPSLAPPEGQASGDIRSTLSLAPEIPLGVYCGNVAPVRALHEFVPVLADIPSLHLAFVTNNKGEYIEQLKSLAAEAGAQDRIHFHPYVPPDALPRFLSTASFGFHSLQHYGNGEVALPNKLFEYLHARIPVVVSDVAAMLAFVNEHRCGVTFKAGDIASVAQAVRTVLEHGTSLRPSEELVREFCWEEQEKKLLAVYSGLLNAK